MALGVLVDPDEEGDGPDRAHRAEHVEDGGPAARKAVPRQQPAQRQREHRAELGACNRFLFFQSGFFRGFPQK